MPDFLKDVWFWTIEEALEKEIWWYACLLFILLVAILWTYKRIKKDLVPILSDEDGNVRITPHALQELVSKSCLNMEGIHSPTTSIVKKEIRLDYLFAYKLTPKSNIQEARKKLKERLEHIMIENLCFSNFGGVDLIIKGFKNSN